MNARSTMTIVDTFLRIFPPPRFLSMPVVGIDISDHSIKFIELVPGSGGFSVGAFGSRNLPAGIVEKGAIVKRADLVVILKKLRREHGFRFVRASLPEEKGYLFVTETPPVSYREARGLIQFKLEENVPLKAAEVIYDIDVVHRPAAGDTKKRDIVVSVFPSAIIESYTSLFYESGFVPLSLEIEAQAIARCVVPRAERATVMVVDFGATRSGISIVSSGVVHYTTTVEIGGDALTETIYKHLPHATEEEIDALKNEHGIRGGAKNQEMFSSMINTVSALRDEINRHYIYWHTHTESSAPHAAAPRPPAIERIILCGGSANLAGLPEYLAVSLKVPVARGNVWGNVLSVEHGIPPIDYSTSLGFAPAIGLALHADDRQSL